MGPEQDHVDDQHEVVAAVRIWLVDVALQPVVRAPVAVLGDRLRIGRGSPVQLCPFQQQLPDSEDFRAVWILIRLHPGVMLAVHRDPLLGDGPRREPEPEPEEVRKRGMQVERPVRLVAMQVDRDRHDRDVGHPEGCEDRSPTTADRAALKTWVSLRPCDAVAAHPPVAAPPRLVLRALAGGESGSRAKLAPNPGMREVYPALPVRSPHRASEWRRPHQLALASLAPLPAPRRT